MKDVEMNVTELLDRAKSLTGSDSRTARAIEAHSQQVCDWRHGRARCPLAAQIKLAALLGDDPRGITDTYITETLRTSPNLLEAGMQAMGQARRTDKPRRRMAKPTQSRAHGPNRKPQSAQALPTRRAKQ
jgi:hypothetical protein